MEQTTVTTAANGLKATADIYALLLPLSILNSLPSGPATSASKVQAVGSMHLDHRKGNI